jgi:hypothetical protein
MVLMRFQIFRWSRNVRHLSCYLVLFQHSGHFVLDFMLLSFEQYWDRNVFILSLLRFTPVIKSDGFNVWSMFPSVTVTMIVHFNARRLLLMSGNNKKTKNRVVSDDLEEEKKGWPHNSMFVMGLTASHHMSFEFTMVGRTSSNQRLF